MSRCRNRHDVTRDGSLIWTGDHWQCRACRDASQRDAQARYRNTAKGMLTAIRFDSGRRGHRS